MIQRGDPVALHELFDKVEKVERFRPVGEGPDDTKFVIAGSRFTMGRYVNFMFEDIH